MEKESLLFNAVIGLAVADAMGVPVEFMSREKISTMPVKNMRSYGTHNQPLGTYSDDTCLTLCLIESIARGLDYKNIMDNFVSWYKDGMFSARGDIFDIGIGTTNAISNYLNGIDPLKCGLSGEMNNGNGSLMRILPIVFYIRKKYDNSIVDNMDIIHNVSSLTHSHPRSMMSCGIYCLIANELLNKATLKNSIKNGIDLAINYYSKITEFKAELKYFNRIISNNFGLLSKNSIRSSGYVIDTLEAALWCLINTQSYEKCILEAVNLGEDTDTVAAVAGGLAGIYYGLEGIPIKWLKNIARKSFIEELCSNFTY